MSYTAMTPTPIDRALLETLLAEMFEAVAEGVAAASAAFLLGDRTAARAIVAADGHVDDLMVTLDHMAEAGLVGDEPLDRRDRQLLVYLLRTAPELERSADLIEHLALGTPQ